MLTPSRLSAARKKRGLSKKELAEKIGLTPKSLTLYEAGVMTPGQETMSELSKALRFPLEFFEQVDLKELSPDAASFRAMKTLAAYKRDAALAAGDLAVLLDEWILKKFNLPKCSIPDLRSYEPEAAAESLRAEWGLGEGAIGNMLHLLESKGVRVYSLPGAEAKVDAFCFWHSQTPFILLNTFKTAERSRFDAAHELGHLVLHRHGKPQGREIEHEADRFASAFLMPRSSVVASWTRQFVVLEDLISLKKKWKVSLAALNYRAHALGLTSDWLYRKFCIEMAERGFTKSEPNGIQHETSQVLVRVFEAMRKEGIGRSEISKELHLNADDISSLVFGLIFSTIKGGQTTTNQRRTTPHLKLV